MRGVCNLLCAYRAKLWIIEKIVYYPFTALEICFNRQPKIQPWHIQIYSNYEVYNYDSFEYAKEVGRRTVCMSYIDI